MLEIKMYKNTATELKNAFDGISSKLDKAQGIISEFEDISVAKEQREQTLGGKKPTQNVQGLWDNCIRYNIHGMGVSRGNEREKGIKEIFETIMTKNFPKLMSNTNPQIQETQNSAQKLREHQAR